MSKGNKTPIKTYRDLVAWQKAMDVAREVYRLTARMPADERFGLTNQMRRAAVSIPSNIAEGFARQSLADYLKFLRIARGSLAELMTQTELVTSMNMLPPNPVLVALLEEEDRILQFLIMSLQRKQATNSPPLVPQCLSALVPLAPSSSSATTRSSTVTTNAENSAPSKAPAPSTPSSTSSPATTSSTSTTASPSSRA